MAVYDAKNTLQNFASAALTDLYMGKVVTVKMSCMMASSHDCKIRIEYNHYDNPH
jgi:hypothetical protein